MKKKLKAIALLILLTGCNSTKNVDQKRYVEEFKYRYFQQCVKKGFNNSKEITTLFEIDKSGYSEPILTDHSYDLINNLSDIAYEKMKADSLNSIGRRAEGSAGKRVFYLTLNEFKSKWLDSIAKAEYRKKEYYKPK